MTAGVQQFLPWQTAFASRWLHAPQRFAHAWLIHGLAGIGKRRFALAAAASLLCEQPRDGLACNTCQACRWVAGGNHPDLRRVRPEAVALEEGEGGEESESAARKTPSREIRVEQIRSLSGWFGTATHRGGWRVAVLYPAHAMNLIAANALLKVLEEPPLHTVFLLVTDTPDQLLPTIVSRCRRLPLPVPEPQVAAQWLREQGIEEPADWLSVAGGAPVRALELARSGESPCPAWLQGFLGGVTRPGPDAAADALAATADALERIEPAIWLDGLQRAFVDLSLNAAGMPPRYFPSQATTLATLAGRTNPAVLSDTAKWLGQQRAVAGHPLSPRLFIHSVLQRCALALGSRPARRSA